MVICVNAFRVSVSLIAEHHTCPFICILRFVPIPSSILITTARYQKEIGWWLMVAKPPVTSYMYIQDQVDDTMDINPTWYTRPTRWVSYFLWVNLVHNVKVGKLKYHRTRTQCSESETTSICVYPTMPHAKRRSINFQVFDWTYRGSNNAISRLRRARNYVTIGRLG